MNRELHKYTSIKINIFVYSYLYRCVNIYNYSHLFRCVICIYIVTSACIQGLCCKFLGPTLSQNQYLMTKYQNTDFVKKVRLRIFSSSSFVCVCESVSMCMCEYMCLFVHECVSLYNVYVCVSIYM